MLRVENGVARKPKTPLGTFFTRKDGTQGVFRDWAIPTHQFQRNVSLDRALALPKEGFM
jgi:hypothetical protein